VLPILEKFQWFLQLRVTDDGDYGNLLHAAQHSMSACASLADQFLENYDEQLKCDNPPTSKNLDGFSL
jgi:hypothetical protein